MGGTEDAAPANDGTGAAPNGLADPSMDRYARLVSRTLEVPTASVTFVQLDRQVNAGAVGLGEETQRSRVVPLTHSFCKHVVAGTEPLVVEDARENAMLRDHPGIADDGIIAYAGWPIHDHTGEVLGSLCAIDSRPHRWTATQIAMLRDLADACSAELTARGQAARARVDADQARDRSDHDRSLLVLSEALGAVRTRDELDRVVRGAARSQLHCLDATVWLADGHLDAEPIGIADASSTTPAPPELLAVLRTGIADFVARPDGEAGPDRAVAYLPLTAEGRIIGVLELVWRSPDVITDRQRDRAPALARYCAQVAHRVGSTEPGPPTLTVVASPSE